MRLSDAGMRQHESTPAIATVSDITATVSRATVLMTPRIRAVL